MVALKNRDERHQYRPVNVPSVVQSTARARAPGRAMLQPPEGMVGLPGGFEILRQSFDTFEILDVHAIQPLFEVTSRNRAEGRSAQAEHCPDVT